MQISLFLFGVFLVLLLAVLLILLFKAKKKKIQITEREQKRVGQKDLSELILILQDKSISSSELQKTSEEILQDHGSISEFAIYRDIVLRITLHPKTNKNIILSFDKELSRLNPAYKKEISRAVTDALNSREV